MMSAIILLNLVSISFVSIAQAAILEVRPLFGPHSGGTLVAISFNNSVKELHRYQVFVGQRRCNDLLAVINQDVILCKTPPSGISPDADVTSPIAVMTPNDDVEYYKLSYTYKPNPSIEAVNPALAFLEGGTQQTIIGRNLDSVAFPAMHVTYKNATFIMDLYDIFKYPVCDVVNSTFMLCPVPKTIDEIQSHVTSSSAHSPDGDIENYSSKNHFLNDHRNEWYMTFHLDGIVLGMLKEYSLKMTENPVVDLWKPNTMSFNGGTIKITGQRLNYGAQKEDFNVTIGAFLCPISELSANELGCQPPDATQIFVHSGKLEVKVRIGFDMIFTVGHLKLASNDIWGNKVLRAIILASAAGLLVIIIICILVGCRMKQLKDIQKTKDLSNDKKTAFPETSFIKA